MFILNIQRCKKFIYYYKKGKKLINISPKIYFKKRLWREKC